MNAPKNQEPGHSQSASTQQYKSVSYKDALKAKGYTLTDSCGCGGTPTETYSLNQNRFVIKPKKSMALHYYNGKQVKAMLPPEVVPYLETI